MKKVTITFLTIVLCLTSSIVSSETIKESDLVVRNGILYKKFTNIPFTGSVEGNGVLGGSEKGTYKAGKKDGVWEEYSSTGALLSKTNYKNGVLEGEFLNFFNEYSCSFVFESIKVITLELICIFQIFKIKFSVASKP